MNETEKTDIIPEPVERTDDIESVEGIRENEKIVEKSYTDPITGKFKEGNPGKPKGATHKKKLTDLIEEEAERISVDAGMDTEQAKRVIAKTIATIMLEGKDTSLIKEYWQQKDGKPKQPLTGGDENDNPIEFVWKENK